MSWDPGPEVAAARDIGKRFNKPVVIVFTLSEAGDVEYASWGRTKKLCDFAKQLADIAFERVTETNEVTR